MASCQDNIYSSLPNAAFTVSPDAIAPPVVDAVYPSNLMSAPSIVTVALLLATVAGTPFTVTFFTAALETA